MAKVRWANKVIDVVRASAPNAWIWVVTVGKMWSLPVSLIISSFCWRKQQLRFMMASGIGRRKLCPRTCGLCRYWCMAELLELDTVADQPNLDICGPWYIIGENTFVTGVLLCHFPVEFILYGDGGKISSLVFRAPRRYLKRFSQAIHASIRLRKRDWPARPTGKRKEAAGCFTHETSLAPEKTRTLSCHIEAKRKRKTL